MTQNREERLLSLLEIFNELSDDERNAVMWVFQNYEISTEMCKAKALTDEKREYLMKRSLEKDDVLFQILTLLERIVNK